MTAQLAGPPTETLSRWPASRAPSRSTTAIASEPCRPPDLRLVAGGRTELESFAHRFARAVVEVVGGDRGPSQLLRWTSESVYDELQQRAALLAGTTPGDRRIRRLRSQVRSVHLFCPFARSSRGQRPCTPG